MDEPRTQRPASNSAGAILMSRAGLAAAIERVRIYERKALPADQLAGLLMAELPPAPVYVAAYAERDSDDDPVRIVGVFTTPEAAKAACEDDAARNSDAEGMTFRWHAAIVTGAGSSFWTEAAPNDYRVVKTTLDQLRAADYPPACILTGADGEYEDDCTTHGHEPAGLPVTGLAAKPRIRYLARFTAEAWVRDQAIEADPPGPQEWDCTTYALARLDYLAAVATARRESLSGGEGVLDNDDLFKDDPDAPEWVRSWSGPFTIRVRTEPMVTVYWQAQATRAADIWYSVLAELAHGGDLPVPPLSELMTKRRILPPGHSVRPGEALAEVLHENGYELRDGGETLIVELAVHDEETSGAHPVTGPGAGASA